MTYLLDTHALLWLLFDPDKLGLQAAPVIREPANHILASAVSLWEVSLKYSLGKLTLTGVSPQQLPEALRQSGIELTDLSVQEAANFHRLPRDLHKDPFDRMLAWQAISRNAVLLTCDASLSVFESCGLETMW